MDVEEAIKVAVRFKGGEDLQTKDLDQWNIGANSVSILRDSGRQGEVQRFNYDYVSVESSQSDTYEAVAKDVVT